MKNYFILTILIIFLPGCKSNNNSIKNESVIYEKKDNNSNIIKKPIIITKEEFLEKVMDFEKNPDKWEYKGKLPCIIDFYADWCAPCKITGPILDDLAVEYEGKIVIYKVNIDEESELANIFGITSIPSLLFCPLSGQPSLSTGIGRSKEETKDMIKYYIEKLLLNS